MAFKKKNLIFLLILILLVFVSVTSLFLFKSRNSSETKNLDKNLVTPTSKLLKNLSLLKGQLPSKQPVVLITAGSMNPVHQQHVGMLEIAQEELEKKHPNFKVVAGYIALNSDEMVKKKLKDQAIEFNHRAEMVRLATEDSKMFDFGGKWGNFCKDDGTVIERKKFQKLFTKDLSDYLNSHPEVLKYCDNVKVMYVVGSDAAEKESGQGRLNLIKEGIGTIVINRQIQGDFSDWKDRFKKKLDLTCGVGKWNDYFIFVDENPGSEISSTRIREAWKNKDEEYLNKNLSPKVLEYIKKHKLFKIS